MQMVRQTGDADLQMQMLEAVLLYPLVTDLRFHRWDDILATPRPRSERKLLGAFWQYARGMAFAGKGDLQQAAAARNELESQRSALAAEVMFLTNNKGADVLALAAATLDAQMAWSRGDKEKSIREWRRAIDLESTIQYDEPPAWHYPIRQSLGAALLRNGQAADAEAVFREALGKRPRDGRLLYGLWQSLVAQKRDSEAALVEHQFKAAWKDATVTLRLEDL